MHPYKYLTFDPILACFYREQIMGKVERDNDRDRKMSHKFAQMYLRQDGVFVLKLVAKNSTDLVVADIIAALWDNYKNKPMFGGSRSDDLDNVDAT
jgi:Innexin